IVQLTYQPTDNAYIRVMTFNGKKWQAVTSKILKPMTGTIRAWLTVPFARLAVIATPAMGEGLASWYRYKNCDCAASPDYPKGSKLKVTNPDNGQSVVVTVNDFGPDRTIHPDRAIDLDLVAFQKIAAKSAGVVSVTVEFVAPPTALSPPS
ncbi:MAG: septal ring lytic transglycosylase RlpA family protein, partial [Patescibacteria group bacterium]